MHPLILIGAAGLAAVLLTMLWRAYARRREKAQFELQQRRYAELKRELLTIGQPVAIRGSTGIVAAVLVVAIGATMGWVWTLDHQGFFLFIALVCMLLAVLLLWQSVPKLGRPLLILSRQEVDIAGIGPLPWSAVEGIEVAEIHHRGSVIAHTLRLYVPDLQQRLGSAHPWVRLRYRLTAGRQLGQIASVRLRSASEAPATIERLCRDLWKAATGRDHPWSIHYSNEQLGIMRDFRRMRDTAPARDPEAELTSLQALSTKIDAQRADSESRQRRGHTGTVAVAAIFVLLVAQQIVSLLTNFVGSEAWLAISLGIATVSGLIGVAVAVRHLRAGSGPSLRGSSLAGVAVAVLMGFVVAVPTAWLLIQTVVGDPIARSAGRSEVLTVVAKKVDRARRYSCSKRLDGAGVGNPICLSSDEFAQLPGEVRVTLRVRRHWIGYHVDSQQIEPSH